jgi:hypothetical protein
LRSEQLTIDENGGVVEDMRDKDEWAMSASDNGKGD